jgi:hypothetical protein
MAVQMAGPLLSRSRRAGPTRLATHLAVLAASALALAVWGVSPVTVLLLAGVVTVSLAALPGLTDRAARRGRP